MSQAVAGNNAILEAAQVTASVKRVIFTSSVLSLHPFERLLLKHPANEAVISGSDQVPALTAKTKVPTQIPIPDDSAPIQRYVNSKIAAANLVHEFGASKSAETSHFSIVNLMPGYCFGPEELTQTKQQAFGGSNIVLSWLFRELSFAPFMGLPMDEDAPFLSETVHLEDVVEGHVKALDTIKAPGKYRNFLLCSDGPAGPVIMDAAGIVRKEFPQEVAEGKIPFAGKLGMPKVKPES